MSIILTVPSYFLQTGFATTAMLFSAALVAAGAVTCGSQAVEMARLEAGMPLFGQDITDR